MTDTPEAAVNAEVNRRVEAVAAEAAAQIDQANKDAEAIARAAAQTDHMARLNELEGRTTQWKSDLETQIAASKAETLAMIEASQASILSRLPPPPPPTTVETLASSPTVNPESEGDEPKNKSKPTEPPVSNDRAQSEERLAVRKRALL